MAPVWLHIGTPKSGTSSLQAYFHALSGTVPGFRYVAPNGRASANELAIAYNRKRPALTDLAAQLDGQITAHPDETLLLSSEMFYGLAPDVFFALMPALKQRPLNVLIYLRRQDEYLTANYLQKSKNGRFRGTLAEFIEKYDGSGADYWQMLKPWRQLAEQGAVRLVPRVMETALLSGGDVVADACAQIGLEPPKDADRDRKNPSPAMPRVQLLQLAASLNLGDPRRVQRQLSARYPQRPEECGPVMSIAERKALLSRFAEGNAALRAAYFPRLDSLFDTADLDDTGAEPQGIPAFTSAQIEEIRRFLEVIAAQKVEA